MELLFSSLSLHQKFLECTLGNYFGEMGTCNTMKNAANKAVIVQMVLTPAVANSPLASECINLKDKAYNAYFTGSDTSSAGMITVITNGNNFLFIFCCHQLCD